MSTPLDGVRVLDMSRILAGPFAAQTLADLGATVIKVERPHVGDDTRGWGPPFVEANDGSGYRDAAYFLSTNRGKKSVTVDFTRPEGRDIVLALARQCDVLLENFKVGGLAKHGLDYESVKRVNPGIVYCSITGFGHTGPYSPRVGYDFMIQGMSGLMSITGEPDRRPGGGPMKVGVAVSDVFTGLFSTVGILGALRHRDRTGEGQHIDMALLDCQVAVLVNQALNFLSTGRAPERLGNAHPNIVPYQVFATADGHIILAIGNDSQFMKFCDIAGCPDLADDPRFATNAARVENREQLVDLLAPVLAARNREQWIQSLQDGGVPCGPINDIEQVFNDGQVEARGLAIEIEHTRFGKVPSVACPIRFSATPVAYDTPPPALGEHVDEVLRELLGLGEAEIGKLRGEGVI